MTLFPLMTSGCGFRSSKRRRIWLSYRIVEDAGNAE